MNMVSYYTAEIGTYNEQLNRVRRKTNVVSGLRLLAFAGLVAEVWGLFRGWSAIGVAGAVIFAAGFIAAVNWYFRLKDERLLWEKLVFVATNERAVLQGEPNKFPDGKAFLTGVIYGDDLDIYGPLSLFHALNRTTTLHGTEELAGWLRRSLLKADAIRERQDAVKVLSGQAGLRRMLTAKGLLSGGAGDGVMPPVHAGDLRTLTDWLNTPPRVLPLIWLRIGMVVMTAVNVTLLFYALAGGSYSPVVYSIAVTWMVVGSFSNYVNKQHQLMGHKQIVLDQYADILAVFSGVETGGSAVAGSAVQAEMVGSAVLRQLRERATEAHGAIRRLSRLTSLLDQRLNVLVLIFLNSLGFYDLQCMVALERWKVRYRDKLAAWIEAVGNIEALNSLATVAFNFPDRVFPTVHEGGRRIERGELIERGEPIKGGELFEEGALILEAKQLAHPLIPANRCVANDFRMGPGEKLVLVTGSNMSGKTTFLRTVGVNLLLAQCGSPVCAASFAFTPMQLLTSLRISDSLQDQTSYFMAELKKLKQIVEVLETGAPALVLIDEILRGTNSEDKTYGSEHFARKLVGYRCLALFATHDLALGALETEFPGKVVNYCFESVIEGGNLFFNYRLERGIARNRNASFLMKKMGII